MPTGRKYLCPCSKCNGDKWVVGKTLQRHADADAARAADEDSSTGDADDESDSNTKTPPSSRPRKRQKKGSDRDSVNPDGLVSDEGGGDEGSERVGTEEPGDHQIEDENNVIMSSPHWDNGDSSGGSDDDDLYMDADEQIEWLENAAEARNEGGGHLQDEDELVANPAAVFLNPLAIPQACDLSEDDEERSDREDSSGSASEEPVLSNIDNIRLVQQFIEDIKLATLENDNLDPATIENLKNPRIPDLNDEDDPMRRLEDPDVKLAIDLYLACSSAPQTIYRGVCKALLKRFPDLEILSLYAVKKLIKATTGVTAVQDDMCINSCHAFTGPLADRDTCLVCSEPRYDPIRLSKGKKVARKQMCTLPLGPQIQTLRFTEKGAKAMQYRHEKTQKIIEELNNPDLNSAEFVYDDVFSGSDYINLATKLKLTADDTVVTFSIDGAQLYQQQQSDSWMAIWVINDFDPKSRFKMSENSLMAYNDWRL